MEKISLLRDKEAPALLSGNRVEDLAFFHQNLPETMRPQLRIVRYDAENKVLTVSFDKNAFAITINADSCSLLGTATVENVQALTGFAAQKEGQNISVRASDQNAQLVWLKSQDFGLNVLNVRPSDKTLRAFEKESKKLKPLEKFFQKARKLTVHSGTLSSEKKSPGLKFLNTLSRQPGKLAMAMKPVQNFYTKNKTAVNLGGMGVSFVLMGPIGTTLFSQIDKARRAHQEAQQRKKAEQQRFEKLAQFAQKGLNRSKKKKAYVSRPYIRFAGHLSARLAATVALTAAAGPVIGATASGLITLGKTIYDTHIVQDMILKAAGKKSKESAPFNQRIHKSLQTAIGVEIQQEKVDKILNKINPSVWLKKQKKNQR